jgi:hypothetical protein
LENPLIPVTKLFEEIFKDWVWNFQCEDFAISLPWRSLASATLIELKLSNFSLPFPK